MNPAGGTRLAGKVAVVTGAGRGIGRIEAKLYSAVDLNTRYPDHTGCLGINGVLAGSDEAEPVRQALIEARAAGEAQLRQRFERAKAEGDLPETARPGTLATFLLTVLHGMAVQAKAGFSREVLEAVAEQALSAWPRPAAPPSPGMAGG